MERIALRKAPAIPSAIHAALTRSTRRPLLLSPRLYSSTPTVADTSFWKSLIPKPLRPGGPADPNAPKRVKSKEWNPATFFIIIFLLIGSMSIQMISLKKNFAAFMRQSDVRIGVLKEVVERLQRGETVDVEKALGTGDEQKEAEWEAMLKEIERDDISRNQKKQERPKQPDTAPVRKFASVSETQPSQSAPKGRSSTASFF